MSADSEANETLLRPSLAERLNDPDLARRLVVTPLLSPGDTIGSSSVDVRLGNQFIVMKREAFPQLDISRTDSEGRPTERYQERVVRRFREAFVLHPRQLVLGSTLEYVRVPTDLMCYVIGKSTWGRMGLVIATATKVDPGFRGCITLEIVNEGEVPLVVYPGLPIAQLVFHSAGPAQAYRGKYDCPVGPEFPRFRERTGAWRFWLPVHRR